jgi:tRNA threonylcarbamoyl adenosine modification protein YeaZ
MRILAIDESSAASSAAVIEGQAPAAEREWPNTRANNQRLFSELELLLDECGIGPASIDLFAVGLGPGSFSGIRTCIAAARAMALPGGKPAAGISSAEALAWDVSREAGGQRVAVVGDARRGRLWFAGFTLDSALPEQSTDFTLLTPGQIGKHLVGFDTIVTPEWERLEKTLDAEVTGHARLVRGSRSPRAATIGALVARRLEAGLAAEPLKPVYLHPPVAESL